MKNFLFLLIPFLLFACEETDWQPSPEQNTGDQAHFVDSLNTNFYKTYSADFELAEEQMRAALEFANQNSWPARSAKSSLHLSIVLYMKGAYEESLRFAHSSYQIYDSLKNESGMARAANELGNYYRKQGQEERALAFWNEAVELSMSSNDFEALGTSYGMLGTFYWINEDFETSDTYYAKCYEIRVQQRDSVGLAYVLIDLADIEQRKGNLAGALSYFEQSNEIRSQIGDRQGVVDNYKMMGDLYWNEKLGAKAMNYYDLAATESEALGYPDLARKSYDSLASIFKTMGNFQEAYLVKEKAEILEDSLFNRSRAESMSKLQVKFDTAQKEKRLAEKELEIQQRNFALAGLSSGFLFILGLGGLLYQRQNGRYQKQLSEEQIKAKDAQIEAGISSQEKERTRFAKDLHDGFGQMISILNLNLQSLEQNPESRHTVFEESSKVLEEMYRELKGICFNLMPQTLITSGIAPALREFAFRINVSGKVVVETDFFGLEDRLTDLQEISLYRITQEWVNNVLKYSDADRINIQITKDSEELTLMVEDNGMGFEIDLLQSGKGNGWTNMNSRANLIEGELELDTQVGMKGSTLIVNAPVANIRQEKIYDIPA